MLGIVAVLVLLSVEGGVGRAERVGATAMLSPRVNFDWMAPTGGGTETTVGTGLSQPQGVAVDSMGAVYIADFGHHRVVKVPAGGGAETAVGTGLSRPEGVAVDRTGPSTLPMPTATR